MSDDTVRVGEMVRELATHHDHGDGWSYSRETGGLEHIRYRSDHTGYGSLHRRIVRAFDPKHLTGRDSLSKAIRGPWSPLSALAWVSVSLRKDKNLPDGSLNGGSILTMWEEDGEYIEAVGPTVGVKIADFLIHEPNNPHAIAIAAEIKKVRSLPNG